MLVYLLRHAIAENNAATDSARDLTAQGLEQARSVAEKFHQRSPLMDKILCSPYNRAQQTAFAIMPLFPDIALSTDASITPDGDVYDVLESIERLELQHVLLVSHNPFLSNLLSVMVNGNMETHRYMDNATLYCISMDVVAPGCGEIVYTLEP